MTPAAKSSSKPKKAALTTARSVFETDGNIFPGLNNVQCVEFMHPDRNAAEEDRSSTAARRFYLDVETWEDLGKPDTITVSVEAGENL